MGVGMIVALLVDAAIIRVLLVPATMRLLGRAGGGPGRGLPGLVPAGTVATRPATGGRVEPA